MKNDNDSIIWFKLDKNFFQTKSDRFIAAVYTPPQNLPIHNLYNVDFFFHKLETEKSSFSHKGDYIY